METDRTLLQFLSDPANYPERTNHVIHHETHISHVFLCDRFVYKIKKPVSLGFLDFSTLRKRHFYCNREVILNSRLAKQVYLGVVPVYKRKGGYAFDRKAGGRTGEYAIKMRKIPHDCLLYNLIWTGRPLYGELYDAGRALAAFHERSLPYRGRRYGGLDAIVAATEENFDQIRPFLDKTIDEAVYTELIDYTRTFLDRNSEEIIARKRDGWVRDGHGDLHTQHICLVKPPVVFDCIEFNEKFRIIDVLEDIAFLFMDLEYRGRFDLSTALCNAYFTASPHCGNDDLLRFYKVYRAVVRGKVESFLSENGADERTQRDGIHTARQYFALARFYIRYADRPFNPVVFMGLSGSGKSTIARDFSQEWVILRSDEIRKGIFGIRKDEHAYTDYGKGMYSEDITGKVYRMLLEKTLLHAGEGKKVVVDAAYLKSSQRKAFYETCIVHGLNPFFVHLFAHEDVLKDRIRKRIVENSDISDAQVSTLEHQIRETEEPAELPFHRVLRLNTENQLHTIVNALKEFL